MCYRKFPLGASFEREARTVYIIIIRVFVRDQHDVYHHASNRKYCILYINLYTYIRANTCTRTQYNIIHVVTQTPYVHRCTCSTC